MDDWWRQSSRTALISIIVVNMFPLIGVLLGRWSLFSVMFLYWAENAVVGVYNALKIALAQKGGGGMKRFLIIPFFLFHYGMFWFVHGVFVFVLFGGGGLGSRGGFSLSPPALFDVAMLPEGVWAALGAMILSHGLSFVNNYIGGQEYLQVTPDEQMAKPYTRVVVLHVSILFGGFVVMLLGQPILALVILIVLKTVVDVRAHLNEHRQYGIPVEQSV